MENKNEKIGIRKNFFKLCLLAFAGSIIYGLPYFRYYYYDAYVELYNLTNVQMGALGSAFGVVGVLSYIVGGILADRFPAKKLLIISLVATGIGGFTHLFFTNFNALFLIYGLWGFTSLLLFWPSLMKVVRMQAKDDEQSRAYGIFEGGRGVTNAVHMAIATAIFAFFQTQALPALGIKWIIIFYSVLPILCGILFIFILKEPEKVESEKPNKLSFNDVFNVLKMPAVWMVVVITFTSYTFNLSFYYFTPYATNVMGASAVFAAILTVLAQYVRPVAATGGGFLADRFGKGHIMLIGFITMALGTGVMILIPNIGGQLQTAIMIAACVAIYFAMYSNFGIYFSLLSEGGIPLEFSGVAIGVVSTLGYLPEIFAPLAAGRTLDVYPGVQGYHIYFGGMIILAIVGAVFCFIWTKTYGKKQQKI